MSSLLHALFLPILLVFLSGCAPESTTPQSQRTFASSDDIDSSKWDFGEVEAGDSGSSQAVLRQRGDEYSIVVATFTGDYHAQSATATKAQLTAQYPQFGYSLVLRPRSRGSVLSYGRYQGYEDQQAQTDMARLRKMVTPQGRPLFAQVLLMKFKPPRHTQNLHPYDLWTVRREFPTMVPIFTLEVAVWGDFESGEYPMAKRRRVAEGYASDLRKKGFEAFFYHNDDVGLSSVTVGLFDHNAVDAETGFFSPEVDAMLSRFPVRLVNGQEVQVYFDPANPSLGSNVQQPCLAEVPID